MFLASNSVRSLLYSLSASSNYFFYYLASSSADSLYLINAYIYYCNSYSLYFIYDSALDSAVLSFNLELNSSILV